MIILPPPQSQHDTFGMLSKVDQHSSPLHPLLIHQHINVAEQQQKNATHCSVNYYIVCFNHDQAGVCVRACPPELAVSTRCRVRGIQLGQEWYRSGSGLLDRGR